MTPMSSEAIIQILIGIIGVLILGIVGLFITTIKTSIDAVKVQIEELADMFRRHVRNAKLHNNMVEGG